MTADGGAAVDVEVVDEPGHGGRWRPDRATWPIWIITAGMPFTFALGMHGLAWPLAAVVFTGRILAARRSVIPWSALPLAVFVCWSALSIATVEPSSYMMFTYRWLLFVGTLAGLVWVTNVDRRRLPSTRVVDWLGWLWIWTIAFGLLAQLLPTFTAESPTTLLLGPLGRVDFVARISNWHLADNDEFLASSFARPAAPWAAANSWGAAVGILTPFFVQSWLLGVPRRRRTIGLVLLMASSVPIIMSANRGLWIGLGMGLLYFTARRAMRGRYSAVIVLLVAVGAVGVLLVTTSAGTLVESRIAGSDSSNTTRSQLYGEAWEGALDSPLIGNGVPRDTDYYKNSPPVGTHGLLWYLMFIHGFVGLILFLGWLAIEVFESGRIRTSLGWCSHLALVIAVIQTPYYGLQPHVIILGIAAGLVQREKLQPLATEDR